VSIDFHERGKKHQTNVAKSLREAREKGVKKQDAEEKLMQDLDAIEKAAMRSFEKDMARDISLSSRDTSYHSALVQRKKKTWDEDDRRQQADKDRREAAIIASAIARTHAVLPQPGEGEKKEQGATPKPPPPPNPWSKVTSSDGLTYYHNAITKGAVFWIIECNFSHGVLHPHDTVYPEMSAIIKFGDLRKIRL
jgi:WW domain-binding protein 4